MGLKSLIGQILWWAIQTPLFEKFRTRICHTRVFLLEGKTKRTDFDFRILVFGNENIIQYISDLAYSRQPQAKALGSTTYHRIPSIIEDKKPDMVLASTGKPFTDFFNSKSFLTLPLVTATLDISAPWKTIYAKMKRIRRRSISKIEKLSYTYEATKDPEKLNFFYDKMYLPFISKRPAKVSGFTPKTSAKEIFARGGLLLVKSNGQYASGIVYHPENQSIHCALLAYNEGMASQAALYFIIKWAKEQGYTEIHYGTTPPFMKDGLFLYKRSWGMKMNLNSRNVLAMRLCNFGEAVQDFLIENPFIFANSKGLVGLILSKSSSIDYNRLNRKYSTPGLHKLLIFHPQKKPRAQHIVAAENYETSKLSAIDLLIKLAFEKNFETCAFDPTNQTVYCDPYEKS